MAVDYVTWVKDALRRNPHLSQSGLARHLNRDRAVISLMLQGKREIKARELDLIEAYLGEPRPDRQGVAAPTVAVVGRIGAAWYEAGEAPEVDNGRVSPVLSRTDMRQVAYRLDRPVMGWPAGSVIVAAPIERGVKPVAGQTVILRRERAGLENLTLAAVGDGEGTPVAIAIEVRIPL